MEASLRAKLESIAERHEELNAMLCDPEITGDKARLLKLSREHAEIDPLVAAFAEYRSAESSLAEALELLADPDMRELAEADVEAQRARIDELDGALQRLLLPRDPNDTKDVVIEIRAGTGG
ncbi:MAG: PCRF domain-containing protein, partial [Myxococcales bacterium]|nr:PCRF domain-containing protein [Myxococcales bacterium]